MKKIITILLIISVFCLGGCRESTTDTPELQSSVPLSTVTSTTDESENSVSAERYDDSSLTDVTVSSTVSNTESEDTVSTGTTQQPVRPEKVTQVYEFGIKTGTTGHLKKVFYDTKTGNTLQYCLFLPDDYSADKKYPVILFLHGAGEIGTDNVTHLTNIKNMFTKNPDYVSQAIVLCPQTPEWWRLDHSYGDRMGTLSSAMNLLEQIRNEYSCDENRIYVTGLSMGGYATWELLENYGDVFAAGVPICGFGNEVNAHKMVDIPIRIYHGTADPTVSFFSSQSMYDAIVAAGGNNVELIPLEGVGHDAWSYAYADTTMFAWMFAQDKSKTTPTVTAPVRPFRVVDSNGEDIITIDDTLSVNYHISDSGKQNYVDIELLLTDEGRAKLERAYTQSNGKEFTVYCRLQKIYSFTATEPPIDNKFVIGDVFRIDSYLAYYNMLNYACLEKQ